jgi:hypothetical protein
MTRGRRPLVALNEAKRIAEKRGEVRHFQHERDRICNFVIYQPGLVALVRIKRVRRLRCSCEFLEREAAEDLAILRSIASCPAISRELWICSPKGSLRIFRVFDISLVELGRDGAPLPVPAVVSRATGKPALDPASPIPIPVPAESISVGENTFPEGRDPEKPTL